MTAPGGDVIEKMLPTDKPALILVDELMNYVSRTRKSGLAGQLYTFLHNLSEVARSRNNVVLAVSIPASELEMNAEDQSDFERFKKLLDRLGKAMIMSAETETSEIIRRRLFEWSCAADGRDPDGRGVRELASGERSQIPDWFAVENAREALKASYPFHPSVLSVFERKWRGCRDSSRRAASCACSRCGCRRRTSPATRASTRIRSSRWARRHSKIRCSERRCSSNSASSGSKAR